MLMCNNKRLYRIYFGFSFWLILVCSLFIAIFKIFTIYNEGKVYFYYLIILPLLFIINNTFMLNKFLSKQFLLFSKIILIPYFLLLCYLASFVFEVDNNDKIYSTMRSNMHTITVALNRYSSDHGNYPYQINELINEKYILEFPQNPYNKEAMKMLEFSDRLSAGNFIYYPIDVNSKINGFYLFGLLKDINIKESSSNINIDVNDDNTNEFVALIIKSDSDNKIFNGKPTPKEILNKYYHNN